jgi:predicted O-linked N-acetylglucosamine transferase (SPINDLY family)
LELATDAAQLNAIRSKLANAKAAGKYFNQAQYVRGLEQAYRNISL